MNNNHNDPDNASEVDSLADEQPSKSQKKRDALRSIELAKGLVQLPPRKRDRFDLTTEISDALKLIDDIHSHGARKRQLHFIGKLLRACPNYDRYWENFENPQRREVAGTAIKHAASIEDSNDLQMRDQLLQDLAGSMSQLRSRYPNANTQLIRQLITRIKKVDDLLPGQENKAHAKLLASLSKALLEGRPQ